MSETAGGKHSSNDPIAFYRSAFLWFLPWLVVGVVALGAVWIAIDALGNDAAPETKTARGDGGGVAADPTPENDLGVGESESDDSQDGKKNKKDKTKKKKDSGEGGGGDLGLVAEGISVQVLNGTSDDEVDDEWADKLEGFGFEIAAINPYSETEMTAIYWSNDEARAAAEAVAEKFGWPAAAKPNELSTEVDVHLYLGEDEL